MNKNAASELRSRIENRSATIGIVGLGYVGLPLIDAYITVGFKVIGFDIDAEKVAKLNQSESYIKHIPASAVRGWRETGRFEATDAMDRLAEADAILICVPTPLTENRDPDLQYVEATAREIARRLRPGQLVVLESTTYPGTTRDVVAPILGEAGLTAGIDFFLAYSPEREDPGNAHFTAKTIPKVVGGIDPASLELAVLLYRGAVSTVVPVSSCEVAEACKILENTYRSVNIAMVNELKMLFQRIGINVWEVIEAAKTKPFGFQPFYPGPGLGGHCIPIDPFYLSWVARKHEMPTRFIELSGEINSSMPLYVVNRLAEALNHVGKPVRRSRVGILGVAYKKDVDDCRESPAFKMMELLQERGAVLSYCDPHVPVLPSLRRYDVQRLASEEFSQRYLSSLDCTLIATDHSAFDWGEVVMYSQLVVDPRNATKNVAHGRDKIWLA